MDRATWVPVALISRPHGLQGEVVMRLYNQSSTLLESGVVVALRLPDGSLQPAQLERVRGGAQGHRIGKLVGVNDADRAGELRGAVVSVQREAFPDLAEGEFYVCDIVGAKLIGPGGELGVVEDVVVYPASEVLVVRPAAGSQHTVEIPLLDDFIELVDAENGTVVAKESILEFFR